MDPTGVYQNAKSNEEDQKNNALAFVRWIQELVNTYDDDLKAINKFNVDQMEYNSNNTKELNAIGEYIRSQALKIEGLEKQNAEQQIRIEKLEKISENIESFLSRAYK